MTGSLRSNRGKYYTVLNLKDENGIRRQKTINLHIEDKPGNKKKAEQAHRATLIEWEKRFADEANKRTAPLNMNRESLFCDYLNIWLEEAKENLQPISYEAYKLNIDKHIYPYFKDKRITVMDIVYADIKAYYTVKGKTLSGNTLKKHHAIIRQTLRKAVQDGLITGNPAAEVTLPKSKRFKGKFLSIEQGNALLEIAKGSVIEPVIILAMMYGLRRSEIAGLKWSLCGYTTSGTHAPAIC